MADQLANRNISHGTARLPPARYQTDYQPLTRIHQKTARGRCTVCKRRRGVAIAEQAAIGEPCPLDGCEFTAEITAEIENRNLLRIVQKKKKRIHITEKQRPQINIIKRKRSAGQFDAN